MTELSVIVTVRNEEKHIKDLLESLSRQKEDFELVVVDAESTDRTVEILKSYEKRFKMKIIVKRCSRGEGRNIGVENSSGKIVIFTDGDVVVSDSWLSEMKRPFLEGYDFVAGKTIQVGKEKFKVLDRVGIYYNGIDLTYPSCNLAYRKDIFIKIGGFDPQFITAEDIDLNLRALMAGAKFFYNENAVVYHKTRSDVISFLKQAFWNGYGRKQLTRKHGNLWKSYSFKNMFRKDQINIYGILRLSFGLIGYLYAKINIR